MKNLHFKPFSLFFIVLISIAIWILLLWNHFNGGIPSHHILANENLPKISNAWGAILMPVLTWLAVNRVGARENIKDKSIREIPLKVIITFFTSLFIGLSIATSFTLAISGLPLVLLQLVLAASLFFPIYRAEGLLGFVLGITYTFGAVLPTGVGLILCVIGYLVYNLVRPVFIKLINLVLKKVP